MCYRKDGEWDVGNNAILHRVAKETMSNKVIAKQQPEGHEEWARITGGRKTQTGGLAARNAQKEGKTGVVGIRDMGAGAANKAPEVRTGQPGRACGPGEMSGFVWLTLKGSIHWGQAQGGKGEAEKPVRRWKRDEVVVEEVRGGQSLRVWKAALVGSTDGLRPKGPSVGR